MHERWNAFQEGLSIPQPGARSIGRRIADSTSRVQLPETPQDTPCYRNPATGESRLGRRIDRRLGLSPRSVSPSPGLDAALAAEVAKSWTRLRPIGLRGCALPADETARDGVEHPIEEINRLGRGEPPPDLERLIDDDGKRRGLEAEHFGGGHAEKIAVHGGHAFEPPMGGVRGDQVVDLLVVERRNAEDVLCEAPDIGLDFVPGLPEGRVHLVGGLLADIGLKQHLHGNFARLASRAGAHADAPATSLRRRLTISIAASAASKPLFPALMPALFSACSSVSQVSTPKLCGIPVSCCDWPMPRDTSL